MTLMEKPYYISFITLCMKSLVSTVYSTLRVVYFYVVIDKITSLYVLEMFFYFNILSLN